MEPPGTQGRQKAGLNRAIREMGWGRFVTLLAYKVAAQGGQLVLVPAAYSSQACPQCGHTATANRPTRERCCCQECGYAKMADGKAAETLEDRGRQRLGVPLASSSRLTRVPRPGPRGAACGGIGRGPPDEAGTAPRLGGIPRLELWGGCQTLGPRLERLIAYATMAGGTCRGEPGSAGRVWRP